MQMAKSGKRKYMFVMKELTSNCKDSLKADKYKSELRWGANSEILLKFRIKL